MENISICQWNCKKYVQKSKSKRLKLIMNVKFCIKQKYTENHT